MRSRCIRNSLLGYIYSSALAFVPSVVADAMFGPHLRPEIASFGVHLLVFDLMRVMFKKSLTVR